MLRNSSGHKATETTTEEREEEFDSDWEIVEEYVGGEEACFPKWFFEYDAPVDPPDTVFSGAKPLTTSGGVSGAVRLREAYTLGLAAAEILRNKTHLSSDFQAPLHLQLPLQNRVHVLLLSRLSDSPCCVRTAKEYREHLTSTTSEKPTLGFSFPSQSEARAFSIGAGLLDLPASASSQ